MGFIKDKTKICLTTLTAFAAGLSYTDAQNAQPERPRLIVGIVINGLEEETLDLLKNHFTHDGFNRLYSDGVYIPVVDYGSYLDNVAATSVIFTGAPPQVSTVASEYVYDPERRGVVKTFNDPSKIGNSTDETLSPAALTVTTISDEVKIDTGDLGKVYAIAPNASQAIIMAGHSGTSGCWIADDTGRWASTTYYKDLPASVQAINHSRPLSLVLDTLAWRPTLSPATFSNLPSFKKLYPFHVTFGKNDPDRYRTFKTSAPVNEEVTTLACNLMQMSSLGSREPVDMISICYTAEPFTASADLDNRPELYDTYIKIDRQLSRLFNAIEAKDPGLKNTIIYLVGTPRAPLTSPIDPKYLTPTGEFFPDRSASLLNMYLMSQHGNGDYVAGYHDNQFFLNHQFIAARGLDLPTVRREAADFIARLSGVTSAVTVDDIKSGKTLENKSFPLPRNINASTAGDIFVAISPGWTINSISAPSKTKLAQRQALSSAPAFILAPGLNSQTIEHPVDARAIAPTVARLLRIRSPNGSQLPALRL